MVNYSARKNIIGGSVVGGANLENMERMLNMTENKSLKDEDILKHYSGGSKVGGSVVGGSLVGGSLSKTLNLLMGDNKSDIHAKVKDALKNELTLNHFHKIKDHAKKILSGDLSMKDEGINLGAVRDIASAVCPQHLVDMIHNDKNLGGSLVGGSFLHTLGKIAKKAVGVVSKVAPLIPLVL